MIRPFDPRSHAAAKTTTMSIFAFYFTANLLREAGWPRKLGMF
jgi:hypothetical protein